MEFQKGVNMNIFKKRVELKPGRVGRAGTPGFIKTDAVKTMADYPPDRDLNQSL